MKHNKIFLLLLFFFITFYSFSQSGKIIVKVTDINSSKGKILLALYNNASSFPIKSEAYKKGTVRIEHKSAVYTFNNIPEGNYSIAILHDENDNNKVDKNFWGIPKERYGFSGIVNSIWSTPNFKETSFWVSKNTIKKVTVKLL